LPLLEILRGRFVFDFIDLPRTLYQRIQANRATILVDSVRVFEHPGAHLSVLIAVRLGPVALRTPLKETDLVLKIRRMCGCSFSTGTSILQDRQSPALERGVSYSVQQDKPSSPSAVFTDEGFAGPIVLLDHDLAFVGVAIVNFGHPGRIAPKQLSGSSQLCANALVFFCHAQ